MFKKATTSPVKKDNVNSIYSSTETAANSDQGGSKTVIIGEPETGKSTLIKGRIYEKERIFPVLDDCTNDKPVFRSKLHEDIFKMGLHYKM